MARALLRTPRRSNHGDGSSRSSERPWPSTTPGGFRALPCPSRRPPDPAGLFGRLPFVATPGGGGQLTVARSATTAAEESPLSGRRGVGWEPDGRESELRSRNDTARRHRDGVAPEDPPGSGETAASPGASSEWRGEVSP